MNDLQGGGRLFRLCRILCNVMFLVLSICQDLDLLSYSQIQDHLNGLFPARSFCALPFLLRTLDCPSQNSVSHFTSLPKSCQASLSFCGQKRALVLEGFLTMSLL